MSSTPESLHTIVLSESQNVLSEKDHEVVRGYDFNEGVDYAKLFAAYRTMGFQASSLGQAIVEVNRMLDARFAEPAAPAAEDDDVEWRFGTGKRPECTIFLGYTSNMASCGVRDILRFVVQHRLVDCVVATAGGIEEDFIKCLAPTYMGDFSLSGRELRLKGINRIGNLLVPNSNYCLFEDWMNPILDEMYEEQQAKGTVWTPSLMIARMGERINNPESIYYWCWKNNIPVFSPALTDGSIGDMIYFRSFRNSDFVLDIARDIRKINDIARLSKKTGMLILGGGLIKHHICNANLMRNGADFSVFVNTSSEYDGSDSGARPDEAVSWGKIRLDAKPVKVYCETSIAFPIICAETFAKRVHLPHTNGADAAASTSSSTTTSASTR